MTKSIDQQHVLLLHDQLQDSRIWGPLESAIQSYAVPHALTVPPLSTLGAKAWSKHIGDQAKSVIVDELQGCPADLVVTVGASAGAGTTLVASNYSNRGLFINPDAGDIAKEGSLEFDEQEFDAKMSGFFYAVSSYAEELSTTGRLPPEGIEAVARASLANQVGLDDRQRFLVWEMTVEQLGMSQPLSLRSQVDGDAPNWLSQIGDIARHCVVALSDCGGLQMQLARVLRRDTAELRVHWLNSPSWFVWLDSPKSISALISEILHDK